MIVDSIAKLQEVVKPLMGKKSIGLVPTMGFLHSGHLSLIKQARKDNDVVIVSVFLNPTQFAPGEDLDTYPRDLEGDVKKAHEHGADYVFTPTPEMMYPKDYQTYVEVEGTRTKVLCAKTRPTHFRGVTTVLTKLFHLTGADRAYFGMKDAQQLSVVKKMVKDLNFPIEIVGCPIVRDDDGLALSSRNVYLSEAERAQALILPEVIKGAKDMVDSGERDAEKIKSYVRKKIESRHLAEIDYVEIVDFDTLEDQAVVQENSLLAMAVFFGKTRLLDNTILR